MIFDRTKAQVEQDQLLKDESRVREKLREGCTTRTPLHPSAEETDVTDSQEPDAYQVLGDALLAGALNQALAMVLSLASVGKDDDVRKEALDVFIEAQNTPGFADWEQVALWADVYDQRAKHGQD